MTTNSNGTWKACTTYDTHGQELLDTVEYMRDIYFHDAASYINRTLLLIVYLYRTTPAPACGSEANRR